ncbi:1,4-dihydroxy-2-naphthoyl-CoA hydrolase in menaquinone biosynthesis [hydrothermal vent metagenome]|uniref:1,4-dihydroxy-2-naphthoyl-CoA hydrolase in menaquinone biosynthesis n=1 Tax=hydrothermal vent metagenome TaxID=652676 RepID=A0A3B0TGI4_9ZZZZ
MTLEEINRMCQNTLISHLEIEFIDFGKNYVVAKMPVNSKKHQPMGVLHGGASLALAETVGSAGSLFNVDPAKYNVLGLQVTGNHTSTISSGTLIARADLIHHGRTTHIWDVKITSEEGKLISVARVTNIITEKIKKGED